MDRAGVAWHQNASTLIFCHAAVWLVYSRHDPLYHGTMWREHVVFEDEEQQRSREAVAAVVDLLAIKTIQMAFFYTVYAICAPWLLSSFGVGTRYGRGAATMALLWLCHIDAASWKPAPARAMTKQARLAMMVLEALKTKGWLLWALSLAPLASGLMAMPWGRMGLMALAARLGQAFFLWLAAMSVGALWASMIAPSELARVEAMAEGRWRRGWAVAKVTLLRLALSLLAWTMFCKAAGIA
jgi:hypothetical protein